MRVCLPAARRLDLHEHGINPVSAASYTTLEFEAGVPGPCISSSGAGTFPVLWSSGTETIITVKLRQRSSKVQATGCCIG